MNKYIKVPPHIAKELGLLTLKNAKLPDGNYVAMATQFEKKCPMWKMEDEAPKMGCALLTPLQLRAEKEGKLVTPLPLPAPEYMPETTEDEDIALTEEEYAPQTAEGSEEPSQDESEEPHAEEPSQDEPEEGGGE